MEKRKRILIAVLIGAVAVIAAVYAFFQYDSNQIKKMDGTFQAGNGKEAEDGILLQMIFDAGTMTYEEKMNGTATIDSGSYAIIEGKLQVFSVTSDGNTKTYFADGDAIIAEDGFYQGKIPKGEKFDAVCTLQGKELSSEITFKSDGTYVQKDIDTDGAEMGTAAGTYMRDGNYIKRTADTKEPVIDLYVHEGQMTEEYFIKVQ